MATREETPSQLPSVEQIELAEYKRGAFLSDLDEITSEALKAMAEPAPLQDYVFLSEHGIATPQRDPLDTERLLRLLVFAVDLLEDVETIREHATALRRQLTSEYHELLLPDGGDRDPRRWQQYKRDIRQWHVEEAERS